MYKLVTLLFLIIGFWAHANELERTFLDSDFNPVKDQKSATYYRIVQPADPLYYSEIHFISDEIKMKGHYLDKELTILQGQCSYYYKNGQLESSGRYENGKKQGYWKRYGPNGIRKKNRYYPSKDELVSVKESSSSLPSFDKEDQSWEQFVKANVKFPEEAKEAGITHAEVNVNLFIDASGKMNHFEILSCPHKCFYTKTIELMAKMPLWNPATRKGKKIHSHFIVKVKFENGSPQ